MSGISSAANTLHFGVPSSSARATDVQPVSKQGQRLHAQSPAWWFMTWREEKGGRSGSSREHSAGLSGALVDALTGPYELRQGNRTAAVRYTSAGCALWKRCRKMTECFVFTGIYRRSINPRRTHERRKKASELKYLKKHTFHTIYKPLFWFLTGVGQEILR